jgi:DNA-binding Lrp family transcriptional regulator
MSDRTKQRAILAVLQEPLELTPRPFTLHARRLGITEEKVIALLRKHLHCGVIRRFAGIVKHVRAGYRHNAMVAFEVAAGRCDTAGETLSRFPFVSHCYRRTAWPDWPYNLYAMMHARSRQEFAKRLKEMTCAVPHASMTVLKTVKEFKKTQFRPQAKIR